MALICTPSARLDYLPCLSCLSDSELDKAFVVAIAEGEGTYTLPEDAGQLMEDSACFTCLSNKQLKQALVSAYLEDNAPGITTIDEIRERLRCLQCANPKQIQAAITYLTCKAVQR